jgi:flagellar motor switch protein FliG
MSLTLTSAGVRKAAILLVQIGQENAAKVMAHLRESEVEAISA